MDKKIISATALLSLCLTNYVNASNYEFDAQSYIPCEQVSDAVKNSEEGYQCSYIKDQNSNISNPYSYVSNKNLPTEIIIYNKGGFLAHMSVEWDKHDPITNSITTYYRKTPNISVGYTAAINIGSYIKRAKFTAHYKTPVKWWNTDSYLVVPYYGRVNESADVNNIKSSYFTQNEWVSFNGSKNVLQIDLWGTYFKPSWGLVQPSGTHHITNTK